MIRCCVAPVRYAGKWGGLPVSEFVDVCKAMDAAHATNPKQIAAYVEKAVSPTMQHVAQETREVHKEILNESWRATHDANELRKSYEDKRSSLEWQEQKLEELRKWYRFKAFIGTIFAAIAINIFFEWTV